MSDFDLIYEKLYANFIDEKRSKKDGTFDVKSYITEYVFGVSTYECYIEKNFCEMFIYTCDIILNRNTSEIIDGDFYPWYLMIMHTSFFSKHTEWGTSIRFPWFCVDSGGEFFIPGSEVEVNHDNIDDYIRAVIRLYNGANDSGENNQLTKHK